MKKFIKFITLCITCLLVVGTLYAAKMAVIEKTDVDDIFSRADISIFSNIRELRYSFFLSLLLFSLLCNEIFFESPYTPCQIIKDSHIELKLKIDKSMCAVMDYFEIFLQRMILCRKSAEVLGLEFWLTINKQRVI